MPHTTKIVETLQTADGIISVCISCCGLHGEWKICPCCGDKEEKGCEHCDKTALEPHPHGGVFPVKRLGFVKDPDTRSWNAFGIYRHDEQGNVVLRPPEELETFIQYNRDRIAAQHQAVQDALAHPEAQPGKTVEHE